MPKKIGISTKEFITEVPLPVFPGTSYTVIPHQTVMNHVEKLLKDNNFEVDTEYFRSTSSGNVAQGVYRLKYQGDPEMGMMFCWCNSYDKTVRFKCAIGGYMYISGSTLISGSMGSWGRKHTGTADTEAYDTIRHQIENAVMYYDQLVRDKEIMKTIIIDVKKRAQILGEFYFEHELLTSEQLGTIKLQFKKPSFNYNVDKMSLWAMYNHIIYALQKAHPKTWMDQQRMIHFNLCNEFNVNSILIDPVTEVIEEPKVKQLSIFDEIKEREEKGEVLHTTGIIEPESLDDILQLPLMPEEVFDKTEMTMAEEFDASQEASSLLHGVDNNPEAIITKPKKVKKVPDVELIGEPVVLEVGKEGEPLVSAQFAIMDLSELEPLTKREEEQKLIADTLVLQKGGWPDSKVEWITPSELLERYETQLTSEQIDELRQVIDNNQMRLKVDKNFHDNVIKGDVREAFEGKLVDDETV